MQHAKKHMPRNALHVPHTLKRRQPDMKDSRDSHHKRHAAAVTVGAGCWSHTRCVLPCQSNPHISFFTWPAFTCLLEAHQHSPVQSAHENPSDCLH
jgi:hypothetical protein